MKIERVFDNNSDITLNNLINSLVDIELAKLFNLNNNDSYTFFTKAKTFSKKEDI